MATKQAIRFASPKVMNVDGRAVWIIDKVVNPTLAAGDTLDYLIPAGLEVAEVIIQADDVESTTTSTFKAGYTPLDPTSTLAPNLAYFVATGNTTFRTGGRVYGAFKPITFQEDVILRITVEVAGTPLAGEVFAIVGGNANGPK